MIIKELTDEEAWAVVADWIKPRVQHFVGRKATEQSLYALKTQLLKSGQVLMSAGYVSGYTWEEFRLYVAKTSFQKDLEKRTSVFIPFSPKFNKAWASAILDAMAEGVL